VEQPAELDEASIDISFLERELVGIPKMAPRLKRIREHLVTDEISIGDYVLTGGELPALMIIDAISRLLPGVLGHPTGAEDDSHSMGLLEYPHYTKPSSFRDWKVPEILLSGDHAKIEKWRRAQALTRTFHKRPDMLDKAELSEKDKKAILDKYDLNVNHLPAIKMSDPAVSELGVEPGDVIAIERDSPTAGKTTFYRGVING